MQYNFGARKDAKKTLGFIFLLLQGIMIRNIVSNEYTIHFIGNSYDSKVVFSSMIITD